jgi:hypothetical protein
MKQIVLVFCVLVAASAISDAQTVEEEIARAVLAAPARLQADAMVIRLAADGSHDVLRGGTNGLVCWDRSGEPERLFSVQCTSVENLPRVKQNRAWNMSGKSAEEIRAMMETAEADGSREVSAFGSVYYSLNGDDSTSASPHLTIAVPFATSDSLGLPSEGGYSRAGTWIMQAGTSEAHIMVPGR